MRAAARDEVKAIRFEGIDAARPAPGVLDAIAGRRRRGDLPVEPGGVGRADPGGARASARRSPPARPRGRRLPDRRRRAARRDGRQADAGRGARGLARSAPRAPTADLLGGLGDRRARPRRSRRAIARELGVRVAVTDTIMRDDEVAEPRLARVRVWSWPRVTHRDPARRGAPRDPRRRRPRRDARRAAARGRRPRRRRRRGHAEGGVEGRGPRGRRRGPRRAVGRARDACGWWRAAATW